MSDPMLAGAGAGHGGQVSAADLVLSVLSRKPLPLPLVADRCAARHGAPIPHQQVLAALQLLARRGLAECVPRAPDGTLLRSGGWRRVKARR